MTICPFCEMPIREGDHVRVTGLAVFHKAPIPNSHALDFYEEEGVEHLFCGQGE